jgi:hypothetical protein
MTKVEKFKSQFPNFSGQVNLFTDDCQQVNFIDVDTDTVEFTTTSTARCWCCSYCESHTIDLGEFLNELSDDDFELLINSLNK